VSVIPGSIHSNHVLQTFPSSAYGASQRGARPQREFALELRSAQGTVVGNASGVESVGPQGESVYSFVFVIPPTLDFIGSLQAAFVYVPASQERLPLQHVAEGATEVSGVTWRNLTVMSELHIDKFLRMPQDTDFFFGNQIEYAFKVKDQLSNRLVRMGTTGQGSIVLALRGAAAKGASQVLAEVPATISTTADEHSFHIRWYINLDAASGHNGQGTSVGLEVRDAGGNTRALFQQQGSTAMPYKKQVTISGHLDVKTTHRCLAARWPTKALTTVEVELSCKGLPLHGVQLTAVLDGAHAAPLRASDGLPVVAHSGSYQLTYSMKGDFVPAGTYRIRFFRAADFKRAVELEALRSSSSSRSHPTEAAPLELFEVTIQHSSLDNYELPMNMEVVATIALGLTIFLLAQRRQSAFLSLNDNKGSRIPFVS